MSRYPALRRGVAFAALAIVVVVGTAWYVAAELYRARAEQSAPTPVEVTEDVLDGPHVLFRGTAPGELYGRVAAVALDDLSGPREVTPVTCDRLCSDGRTTVCLRTHRGVVTTYEAEVLDAAWQTTATWPLPGIPSRTRLSPDGLVATTAFVTGHGYARTGFSTETTVHDVRDMLGGHMSLVGPRPALPHEVAAYEERMRRRLRVKPGMTGLWQVSGRSDLPWDEAVRLDVYYAENWTPFLDLLILAQTAHAVVSGRGAY